MAVPLLTGARERGEDAQARALPLIPMVFSRSVKLNEHFLNTSDFLDTIKSNLDKALGQK